MVEPFILAKNRGVAVVWEGSRMVVTGGARGLARQPIYVMKKMDHNLDEFIGYVFKRDETSVVLKSHLFLEQAIDQLLCRWTKNPEIILKNTFKNKVDFLYSIGIITKEFQKKLSLVNTIRNKFSHEYSYELSKEDISTLSKLGAKGSITVPYKLNISSAEKKSILFATAVSLLIQPLQYINEAPEGLSRQILQDAIDNVLRKNAV